MLWPGSRLAKVRAPMLSSQIVTWNVVKQDSSIRSPFPIACTVLCSGKTSLNCQWFYCLLLGSFYWVIFLSICLSVLQHFRSASSDATCILPLSVRHRNPQVREHCPPNELCHSKRCFEEEGAAITCTLALSSSAILCANLHLPAQQPSLPIVFCFVLKAHVVWIREI